VSDINKAEKKQFAENKILDILKLIETQLESNNKIALLRSDEHIILNIRNENKNGIDDTCFKIVFLLMGSLGRSGIIFDSHLSKDRDSQREFDYVGIVISVEEWFKKNHSKNE